MGADIHVYILKRNRETNAWKHIKLYTKEKGKFKLVDVYPYRNYELFDILNGKEDEKYSAQPISKVGLPPHLKKEIEEFEYGYGFKEINLADLKLYLRQVPKIRDWDYEDTDPNAWKDNPVKFFIERIEQYIDFADYYWDIIPASDIKIIYWFDN